MPERIKRKVKETLLKGPLKKRLRNFSAEEMVEIRNKEGNIPELKAIRKINAVHTVNQMEGKHQDKITDHQVRLIVNKLLFERVKPRTIESAMEMHNHNPKRVKKALETLGWEKVEGKWIKAIENVKGTKENKFKDLVKP